MDCRHWLEFPTRVILLHIGERVIQHSQYRDLARVQNPVTRHDANSVPSDAVCLPFPVLPFSRADISIVLPPGRSHTLHKKFLQANHIYSRIQYVNAIGYAEISGDVLRDLGEQPRNPDPVRLRSCYEVCRKRTTASERLSAEATAQNADRADTLFVQDTS